MRIKPEEASLDSICPNLLAQKIRPRFSQASKMAVLLASNASSDPKDTRVRGSAHKLSFFSRVRESTLSGTWLEGLSSWGRQQGILEVQGNTGIRIELLANSRRGPIDPGGS